MEDMTKILELAQETEAWELNEQWDLCTEGGTEFFLGIAPGSYEDHASGTCCTECGFWADAHRDGKLFETGRLVSFADFHRRIRLDNGAWVRGFYLGEDRARRYADLIRAKRATR
ncbi:hypothetical protein DMC64_41990 [Amycolatopsis sp. WAC 04197]|nr:hypothetical protein DMC64_41990 [Amycolatopsis sp. WAC 04197]